MRRLDGRFVFAAGLGLAFLTGCGNKSQDSISSLSKDKATSLNAQRSSFDTSEDPQFKADTHHAAGRLAESQESLPAAIAQYKMALARDPKHLPSLYRLGVIYARTRSYPEAIATWTHYVKASGGDAQGLANLAYCYELAGRPGDAEATYQQGVAKDPQNAACRVNYGLMLARAGRHSEAMEQLRAVLSESQAHYNLGSLYEQLGRRDLARAEYRRALELSPDFPEAQTRLAALK